MVAPGAGQDLGELFDLYEAPKPSIAEFRGEPTPKGMNKARKLVHTDGDWHRAVHIWIYNTDGKLILQKRSESKDTFPGRWDVSVGGHITSGDTVMETAHKEVEEELGISIDVAALEHLGTIATTAKGSSPVGGDFLCNEYKDVFLLKFDGSVAGVSTFWRAVAMCLLLNDPASFTFWHVCTHVFVSISVAYVRSQILTR